MAQAASTPEQKYELLLMKWPEKYPFASVWVVKKYASGNVYPVREVKGATDASSSFAQKALSEEKLKLFEVQQRDELSETCSS